MKKTFLFLLPAFIAIISSCSNGGEKYTLKPDMKVGESYALEYKIDIDQDVMGMNNKMLMSMGYQIKIKSISPKQDIEMDFMYDHMGINMKTAMFNVSYDSDSAYTAPENSGNEKNPAAPGGEMIRNMYSKIFGGMVNKPIQVTIDTSGKVTQVKGYQEIMRAIKDSLDSDSPAEAPALDNIMSEDQINQVFQQTFGTFPNKPVAIGEKWVKEVDMSQGGMPMKFVNTYKLLEVLKKENEAIIEINSIITMGVKGTTKDNMKMEMSGTQSGKLTVDLNTGLIKTGKIIMDIKMEMETMGQKISMTMKGTTMLTGKKL